MTKTYEGRCACSEVRYRMTSEPMFVHCCHCSECQRVSGSAFALNAMIEADRVELLSGDLEMVNTPTPSGNGQKIYRCRQCKVAVWSNYAVARIGDRMRFVRVGTLDRANEVTPDIHIYTASKQPWVGIPEGAPCVDAYYDKDEIWPAASLKRRQCLEIEEA